MNEKVIIGPFSISNFPHGGIWVCKEDGEGMQITKGGNTEDALIEALEQFFKEYM